MKTHHSNHKSAGYTLVEALVASVLLMMGIAAAAQLTLTLLTQEEINRRTALAINTQENAVMLYQMGMTETDIPAILPLDSVIENLNFTLIPHDLGSDLGEMEAAEVTVVFNPAPAQEDWSVGLWSGGENTTRTTDRVTAYRSVPPTDVE